MKATINILSIGVFLPFSLCYAQDSGYVWGSPKVVFSSDELQAIAKSVCTTNMICRSVEDFHDFFCRDSVDIQAESTEERNRYWRNSVLDAIYLSGFGSRPRVEVKELPAINPWRNKFLVFCCECSEFRSTIDSSRYSMIQPSVTMIVALDFGGTFYYLAGFAANDMRQLIRSNLGRVTNLNMATQIVEFYLRTVKGLGDRPQIKTNSIAFQGGLYVAKVEAQNSENQCILHFTVTISPDGQVDSSRDGTK